MNAMYGVGVFFRLEEYFSRHALADEEKEKIRDLWKRIGSLYGRYQSYSAYGAAIAFVIAMLAYSFVGYFNFLGYSGILILACVVGISVAFKKNCGEHAKIHLYFRDNPEMKQHVRFLEEIDAQLRVLKIVHGSFY